MDCVAAVLLVQLGFACNHPRLRFVSHESQRFVHRHPTLCASILSAAPVSQVLSVPVCDHPLRGAFLRRSTLPAVLSCVNTCALRKAVLVHRAALQPLDTEKAR